MHSDMLEVARTAVFLGEEGLTGVEFSGRTAVALGRVGAVEVGNVTVSDITEPVRTIVSDVPKTDSMQRKPRTSEPSLRLQTSQHR